MLLRAIGRAPRTQSSLWRLLGGLEMLVGIGDLLAVRRAPELSVALLATASAYLALSRTRAPSAPCGCLGAVGGHSPSRSSQLRALLLLLAALAAANARSPKLTAPALLAVLVELALLAAISPEISLGRYLRSVGRRARCATDTETAGRCVARVYASALWPGATGFITDCKPLEMWREGCLRYITFAAAFETRPATAVFAMPVRGGGEPERLAIVDEDEQAILHQRTAHEPRESLSVSERRGAVLAGSRP